MDFSELISGLFSNEIFQGIWGLISPTIATVVAVLWGKAKKKLTEVTQNSDSNLKQILDVVKSTTAKLEALSEENKALIEENKTKDAEIAKLAESVTNIGNIVSIGFLDTKGISADAKVKISEAVSSLAKKGLNLEKTQEAVNTLTDKAIKTVEAVNQIKETLEIKAKESVELAATTEAEAIDLMNRIVDTHE